MIGNILHTFGSKIGIAIISFAMLLLNARYLGTEGVGTIGLIVLGITIFQLFSNLLNGSIVYFSSKLNQSSLVLICYLWSILCIGLFWFINTFYPLFEENYQLEIYALAFLQSAIAIHSFILVGNEQIKKFNALTIIQSIVTIVSLAFHYVLLEQVNVFAFTNSLFIAYGITLSVGILYTLPLLPKIAIHELLSIFKKSIHYGFYIQLANTFQLLNYRISYYIVDAFSGRAALGLYHGGVRLSEALVLPGKSIAVVQYTRISRKNNTTYSQRITFFFMKISFFVTALGALLLALLPSSLYIHLLGEEFNGIKSIIVIMIFGILMQSAEVILSHYFSGTGQQKLNSYSAFIGLILTLLVGFTLIPEMGAIGAAITSVVSYGGMFLYLFILMNKQEEVSLPSFLPNKNDWKLIKRLLLKR